LEATKRLGGESWFALGDYDLAMHLSRTSALAGGATLSQVTARFADALGVRARILPMADAPLRTMIDTDEGLLGFQEWFVRRRAQPAVRAVRFAGAAVAAPGVLAAIDEAGVVVIGPSNPYVSIDPILSLDGVRAALARRKVVAVSPIVGGRAVKGPLAEMIQSLAGRTPSAHAVAAHYGALVRGWVVERGDEAGLPFEAHATAAVM